MGYLASAAVAVLGLAVVGGALDTWLWPGPALAFFRPQLTLALALAALLALLADRHRAAVAGFAVAVAGAALLLPAARGRAEPPATGTATVRLLALNLTYHHDDVEAVAELIRRERPDVITLSELTPEWSAGLAHALAPYAVRATEAHEGKAGIGLWGREHALREPQVVRLTEDARPSVQGRSSCRTAGAPPCSWSTQSPGWSTGSSVHTAGRSTPSASGRPSTVRSPRSAAT